MESYDVAVIGGGAAGPNAAREARARGLSVCIIEEDRFGGSHLWRACVPSKTLIECARRYRQVQHADLFGTEVVDVKLDFAKVQARRGSVIAAIAPHDDPAHLEEAGIRVCHEHASFVASHELQVGNQRIHADHVVLATGSHPHIPLIPGLEEVGYLTSLTAITLPELPESMIVLGAGPVGCEFAQLFARFGTTITLIDAHPRVLIREDADTSVVAREVLERDGVTVITGAAHMRARKVEGAIALTIVLDGQERQVTAERILVATGRMVQTDGLNLEATGVTMTETGLTVYDTLQTNVPHIWACGDAAGKMLFTHAAEDQGRHVGRNVGRDHPERWDDRVAPRATFLDPEVASVGLTEDEAAMTHEIVVGKVPFTTSDRAFMRDETTGFVKLIVNRDDGQILGAHITGPHAGDLIHEPALAMTGRVPVNVVGQMLHLYPSLLDPLRRAAQEAEAKRKHPPAEERKAA